MAILDHNGQPWESNGTNGHAPEARFDPATGRLLDKDRLWGDDQFALPHVLTHASIYSTFRAYWHGKYDEAKKHSYETMLAMWNDTSLRGMLNERIYNVLSLPCRIEVPNEKDPLQKEVRDHLTAMIEQIYDFHDICWSLLNAIWYGRSAVQWKWHWINYRGRESLTVKDWLYHNGDKIGGMHNGDIYIMVYAGVEDEDLPGAELIYTTEGGRGLIVKGSWKDRFCVHRHLVDDADFFGAEGADAVHGVGVRSVLYWLQYLKLEWLANITDYMERVGLGVTLIRYPSGNPQYKEEAERAAKELMSSRTVILVPTFGEQNNRSVERIEVPMSGADMLWKLIQHVEETQRIYVVGQTMSTGNDQSNSLGGTGRANLALNTKTQIRDNDAKKLSATLTGNDERPGLLSIMQKWTFPETWPSRDNPNGFRARFVIGLEDSESVEKLTAATTIVKDFGLKVKTDEIYGVAGFTKPDEGDDVIGGQPPGEIDPNTGLPMDPSGMPPDGMEQPMDEVPDDEEDEPATEEDYDLDEVEPATGTYRYAEESPAAPAAPEPAAPKAAPPGQSPAKPIQSIKPLGQKSSETVIASKTTDKAKPIYATHPEHLSQHQPDKDWEPVQTRSGNVAHRNPYTGHVEYTPDKPGKPALGHAQEHLAKRHTPPQVAPAEHPHVQEALKSLHPSAPNPEGLAHLVGGQSGMQMQIHSRPENPDHLQISGQSHEIADMDRSLKRNEQGELELHNHAFKVRNSYKGQGVGEKAFSQQVEQAAKSGIHRIKTIPAKSQSKFKDLPLLGYNAPLDEQHRARLQNNLRLPDAARNAQDVLELYQTPEGRDWWAKHGQATEMTFDLHPGSKSMAALQARRQERGLPSLVVPSAEEYEATQKQHQAQQSGQEAPTETPTEEKTPEPVAEVPQESEVPELQGESGNDLTLPQGQETPRTPSGWGEIEPGGEDRLSALGAEGKVPFTEPKSQLSDEDLTKLAQTGQPAPLPAKQDADPKDFQVAWDVVSTLWPEGVQNVTGIRYFTPEELKSYEGTAVQPTAAAKIGTGELVLPKGQQLDPEVLWHELVHLQQVKENRFDINNYRDQNGLSEHGRLMESEAHQRGNIQAKELIDRFQKLKTQGEPDGSQENQPHPEASPDQSEVGSKPEGGDASSPVESEKVQPQTQEEVAEETPEPVEQAAVDTPTSEETPEQAGEVAEQPQEEVVSAEPPIPEQAPESLFPEQPAPEAPAETPQAEATIEHTPEAAPVEPPEPQPTAPEAEVPAEGQQPEQPQVAVESSEIHESETLQPKDTPEEAQAQSVDSTFDPEATAQGGLPPPPAPVPGVDLDLNKEVPPTPGAQPLTKEPLPLPPTPATVQPGTGRNPEYEQKGQQITQAAALEQKPLGLGGINSKFKVKLDDGSTGVWKPMSGEQDFPDETTGGRRGARVGVPAKTSHLREAAFSNTANILGWSHLVPVTVQKQIGEEAGSVQHWVDGTEAQYAHREERYDGPEDLARAAVLDYLAGTIDRHSANWMLRQTEGGKQLALIDNGLSFPREYNQRDPIELNLLRRAYQNNLDMPDLSHWENKWPELEQSYRETGMEEEAIQLTKQRFDALLSASSAAREAGTTWKLDNLPAWREGVPDLAHMLDEVVFFQKLYRKNLAKDLEKTALPPAGGGNK